MSIMDKFRDWLAPSTSERTEPRPPIPMGPIHIGTYGKQTLCGIPWDELLEKEPNGSYVPEEIMTTARYDALGWQNVKMAHANRATCARCRDIYLRNMQIVTALTAKMEK